MKTVQYKINMADGSERTVNGVVVNDIWGIDKRLTSTATYNSNGEKKVSNRSDYFLTHIPSGMLVTNARTRKALMELCNRPDMMDENDHMKIISAVFKYWDSRGWKD